MLSMSIDSSFASIDSIQDHHQPRRDFHRDFPRLALGHLSFDLEAFYGDLIKISIADIVSHSQMGCLNP